MPALVKRRVGSSTGTQGLEGTWAWDAPGRLTKKSMKVERTRSLVQVIKGPVRGGDRGIEYRNQSEQTLSEHVPPRIGF
jgi:hypothetical protein